MSTVGLVFPLTLSFKLAETRKQEKSANSNYYQKQYYYEQNGVSITVAFEVYTLELTPTVNEIMESISERLKHAPGLELIDLQQHHSELQSRKLNSDTNLQSIFHSAKYLMQPFAKEIHYEVRNYLYHNQRWMITASYKSCDTVGQKLTERFFNTLKFIGH
ncbi:hypothetical protein [Kaarinaea lacus]